MLRTTIIVGITPFCLLGCAGDRGPAVAFGEESTTARGRGREAGCEVAGTGRFLADEVRETSGLARSLARPDLLWTHNDAGNGPDLFAVDTSGAPLGRVRLQGPEAVDWEDMASASCADGACLFVADIGDNDAERGSVTVYRVEEPDAGAVAVAGVVALHARFPDAPQDAEALFALPSGEAYLITKGRHGSITVYRYPMAGGGIGVLEPVRTLWPQPDDELDRVTGATASPNGQRVAIRTYRQLFLYDAAELLGDGDAEPTVVDLMPLREAQGEAVALDDDGTVWLTSEAESRNSSARLSRLRCGVPGE